MDPTVSISQFMSSISALEDASAALYAFYAEIFEDNESAASVFRRLKRDEENHRNQIELQRRIIQKNLKTSDSDAFDLKPILRVTAKIEAHIQEGIFDIRDAVDFALHIEEDAVEIHYRTLATALLPELADLADLLQKGDESHLQKLKDLRDLV